MRKNLTRPQRIFILMLFGLILSFAIWTSCGEQVQSPSAPQEAQEELVLSPQDPGVQSVMQVQQRHTETLLRQPGIIGTATGMTEDGRPAILVFAESDVLAKGASVPATLEQVPVIVQVTGKIKAIKGPPGGGGGFDPTAKHRPAPNGVSIGHPDITAGTLGCIVEDASNTYILSNNHVMANENQANIGDPIYQPGPYDGGTAADQIATLSDFEPINFSGTNTIDAAIAAVDLADVTGATDPDAGSYGAPRSTTVAASLNLRVMKYGRTTEHTKGRVQAINATVNVGYGVGVATFTGQIVIGGGGFSAGGDSGSLIVVEKGNDARKPVGLLFAGSSSVTIANPIDAVLNKFNVTVFGN